jgi:GWxTD domain-containing protein
MKFQYFYLSMLLLTLAGRSLPASGQAVNAINFNYLYNLQGEVDMRITPVVYGDSVALHFQILANNPNNTRYIVHWEKRDSYAQRQGTTLVEGDTVTLSNGWQAGRLKFAKPDKPWVLLARITNPSNGKKWHFIRQIESHYPVNGFITLSGVPQWQTFHQAEGRYTVHTAESKAIHFSFYRDEFPTPSPPFADKELKMDRFLFPDSTFTVSPGSNLGPFRREGLYLAQQDTLSSQGFAFMIKKAPYPRYNTLAELKGPLLFVTTQEENEQLGSAGEDKAKFDKVILTITGDKDRAKTFMKNYFKRVEYANYFFTSYKEGWKTDRGMVFIVFGAPDEVSFNGQQETWQYKSVGLRFVFNKAGSVYGPDHSVLVRNKDYAETWYMTVDLWRKSRF